MALAKVGWKVVGILSGLVAARTAKVTLDKTWATTRGGEPPRNPAAPGTSWPDALTWAVAAGATVGVARLVLWKARQRVQQIALSVRRKRFCER